MAPFAFHELVIRLQPDKESFRYAEIARKPQVRVGGDGAFAEHDLVDPPRRHADPRASAVCESIMGLRNSSIRILPG